MIIKYYSTSFYFTFLCILFLFFPFYVSISVFFILLLLFFDFLFVAFSSNNLHYVSIIKKTAFGLYDLWTLVPIANRSVLHSHIQWQAQRYSILEKVTETFATKRSWAELGI